MSTTVGGSVVAGTCARWTPRRHARHDATDRLLRRARHGRTRSVPGRLVSLTSAGLRALEKKRPDAAPEDSAEGKMRQARTSQKPRSTEGPRPTMRPRRSGPRTRRTGRGTCARRAASRRAPGARSGSGTGPGPGRGPGRGGRRRRAGEASSCAPASRAMGCQGCGSWGGPPEAFMSGAPSADA